MPTKPQLSMALMTFSADDPGSWQHVLNRAKAADKAGVDRLVVSDHVVYGENLEAYARPELGGTEGGKQPVGPDGHWLEPMTTLGVVAGITSDIRLGTNILLAALRRPVVLAKSLSTLDVLSGGRLDLGVGVGWQREEYEAAGLPFEKRGRLLDHTLAVMQTLWREQQAEHKDELLSFEKIHQMPKPMQAGGVPIWVSGTVNDRVIKRITRFGSGWIPWGHSAKELSSAIVQMREGVAAAGRDPSDIQIVGNLPPVRGSDGKVDIDRSLDGVPALVEAGVTDVRAGLNIPDDPSAAHDYLSGVVQKFRSLVGRS
jgi:probable F420-dependent oxidoreductase